MTWDVSMPGLMILSEGALDRFLLEPEKRSISAADFRAFDSLSQSEAAFRQNVWQSGAQNSMPKYG
jgi:hypothetical protein